jgi:hypothetical protein
MIQLYTNNPYNIRFTLKYMYIEAFTLRSSYILGNYSFLSSTLLCYFNLL